MSQAVNTEAIVLTRTNFGEADRILTVLTPDHGKRRLMAKGVRKQQSKLAGGIELFSISHISYIPGKSEIDTLISTRLKKHYGHIVEDVERTMLGYELLKRLNRATEEATGEEYFNLLDNTLAALDDSEIPNGLVESWFNARVLKLGGHQPNLRTDINNKKLTADQRYFFDNEAMAFRQHNNGTYTANHIKLIRLLFGAEDPLLFKQLKDVSKTLPICHQFVYSILEEYIRL